MKVQTHTNYLLMADAIYFDIFLVRHSPTTLCVDVNAVYYGYFIGHSWTIS
jgi:hypothetical protein